MLLRPPQPFELTALAALLDRAFSRYPEALRYTPAVVGFFLHDLWVEPPVGVVAELGGLPVGVALGGPRRVRGPRGEALLAVHIGPVGVDPALWRQGVGRRLCEALEDQARARGADLLTLTTNPAQRAHALYSAQGFTVLERYPLILRAVHPSQGAPEVASPPWPALQPAPGRPQALVEQGPLPMRVPPALRPRCARWGDGRAWTLAWPVVSRGQGGEQRGRSAQLLALRGPPGDREQALERVVELAGQDGCGVVWCAPSVATTLPRFGRTGSPWVWRMAKALTPAGAAALDRATGYDELGPAS